MNILLIITLCIFTVKGLRDDIKATMEEYHKQCISESGVEPELFEKAQNGEFVDDEELKKEIFCYHKKIEIIDENGDIDEGKLGAWLQFAIEVEDSFTVRDVVSRCANKKTTPQQTSFELARCYYEYFKMNGIPFTHF